MREFQERNRRKNFLYSKPVLFALFALVWVFGSAAYSMYEKASYTKDLRDKAKNEYERLAVKEASVIEKTRLLSSERGKEEILRDQYRFAKADEGVMVIVEQTASSSPQTQVKLDWFERMRHAIVSSVASIFE